jgi:hypothetical protein
MKIEAATTIPVCSRCANDVDASKIGLGSMKAGNDCIGLAILGAKNNHATLRSRSFTAGPFRPRSDGGLDGGCQLALTRSRLFST